MHVRLYVDGGNVGPNPSPTVYWSVGREHDGGAIELLTARATSDRHHTNNAAEWLALNDGLSHAARMAGLKHLTIHSDSQLIVNQFNGRFKVSPQLQMLCKAAQESAQFLMDGGVRVEVTWVGRKENVKRLGH